MRLFARLALALVGSLTAATGCGGREAAPPQPPLQETPADEILRIGERWLASSQQRGLLSPPSPISVFVVREESRLELHANSARESLLIEEELDLRDGGKVLCQTRFEHSLGLRWGRREGEAAVELRRPALRGTRSCQGGTHPESFLERAGGPVRFVLRSDTLIAVDPPREERQYVPLP